MIVLWLCGLADAGTWEQARERHRKDAYLGPTTEERLRYGALVRDLAVAAVAGTLPPTLAQRADALGLGIEREGAVIRLVEAPGHERGVGVVAVRVGATTGELVLQAPHPLSDLHTGALAGVLFDAGEVRAACIATVHRDATEGSDPSRAADGWLTAATLGLAEALPDPLFVQLHGFGATTTEADVVVSQGASRLAPVDLAVAVRRIGVGLAVADVRTGDDVPALAARGNAQSAALAGRGRFLHVEMSEPVRERLARSEPDRAALADALLLLASREEGLP